MNFVKAKIRYIIPIALVLVVCALFGPRYIHDYVYDGLLLQAKEERDGNFPSRSIEKEFYLKALKEARTWNDAAQIGECECCLGMIAFYDGDYDKALALLQEALEIDKKLKGKERNVEFIKTQITKIYAKRSEIKTVGSNGASPP